MTFFEFSKSLIDSARDRMKTPIAGAYTMSFIFYNWKPILYLLFSDARIECKLIYLNDNYSKWGSILWPLVIAIIYLGVVQYVMWFFDAATIYAIKGRSNAKHARNKHDLMQLEQVIAQERINEETRAGKREMEALNNEIEQYKSELTQLRNTSQLERESHAVEVKSLQDKLARQTNQLKHYNTEVKKLNDQAEENILKLRNVQYLSRFTPNELRTFKRFIEDRVFNNGALKIGLPIEQKKAFIEHGLIKELNNGSISLTDAGQMLYNYLEVIQNKDNIKPAD